MFCLVIDWINFISESDHEGALGSQSNRGSDSTVNTFHPGSLVALYVPKYRDELPLIGKVSSTENSNELEVEWMVGTYSGVWKTCKRREGRNSVPWKEKVERSSVLFEVELTKSMRIPGNLKTKLRETYNNIITRD